MSGIHRQRPLADRISACTGEPAVRLGDGVWVSPGLSNSYLVETDDGPIVINTGMGFEGPLHRRAYAHVTGDRHVRAIILTQGHYDHVGGVDALRDEDSDVIAQASWTTWRDDNERLEAFRASNAAFAWMTKVAAGVSRAQQLGVERFRQARPRPTTVFTDTLELTIGGRRLHLLAVPGGETTDSLAVWLPDERIVFTGNLTGPLFGHVPNLVTMRGDRYRDALAHVSSLERVRALEAERLLTGHFDPIDGAALIADELTAMRDAMQHVHDRTVEGMNAGTDVHTLMRTVSVPSHLDLGEGYGRTSWNVRAIWESYAGWFHHRSTTELYPVPMAAVASDIVAVAGAAALLDVGRAHLSADRPVHALHLTDLVLTAAPHHAEALSLAAAATASLLDSATNFWERAWLQRCLDELTAPG